MDSTTDVIILSSSPLERDRERTPVSSRDAAVGLSRRSLCEFSPVPSPSELFPPPLRSRFFDTPTEKPSSNAKSTAPVPVKQGPEVLEDKPEDKPKKRGRKPKSETQMISGDSKPTVLGSKANASTKAGGTRKKRADGGTRDTRNTNKTITGKVAKPRNAKSKELNTEIDQPSISKATGPYTNNDSVNDWNEHDLQLEAASKRRLDWTPMKDTTIFELDDAPINENGPSRLGTLFSEYGYSEVSTCLKEPQVLGDVGPTKRRRIELVDPRVYPPKPIPLDVDDNRNVEEINISKPDNKPRKNPKKLTTITARVTASYANSPVESSDSLAEETAATSENSEATAPRSRKKKKKEKSKLGAIEPEFIVLSPEAAVKSLESQDLMFGTCSQLERDDSPSLLRETQIAAWESEKELLMASQSRLNRDTRLGGSSTTTISRLTTPKNMWSIAARDTDGSLIEAEVLDLVDTPPKASQIMSTGSGSCDGKEKENHATKVSNEQKNVSRLEIHELPTSESVNKTLSTTQSGRLAGSQAKTQANRRMPHYDGFTDAELAKEIKAYGFKAIKNRNKMIEILKKCWESKHGPSNRQVGEDQQASLPADSSVPAKPKQTERKPRQPRKTQSKRKPQQRSPNTANDDVASTPVFGDNRKTTSSRLNLQNEVQNYNFIQDKYAQFISTRSFLDVEEIQDSEEEAEEVIPSPKRPQSQYKPPLPNNKQPLPVISLHSSLAPAISPYNNTRATRVDNLATEANSLPTLGEQVTKAVREEPRLNSSRAHGRLSWHEKILMYDPIILEDFTAWLNTEGLCLVNEDREVSASFVRRWCESKGICCCYKVRKTDAHY